VRNASSAVRSLERCLAALLEATDAAQTLGIDTEHIRAVHADAVGRLGFPGHTYVLALVGGTGVGKSSLLNALAGASVSPASARRPTTTVPVAWIPAEEREDLDPLLDWLDVRDVHQHDHESLRSVAILDLPDIDSVAVAHRERVEALLPRVDAVAWVTDPEKYHDAVLHDDFLRAWLPRLDRQAIILNKVDRLRPLDRERVRRDLVRDAERAGAASGRPPIPVLGTAAIGSDGAAPDVGELRSWLADGLDAKTIIRERLAATVANLADALAREAGVDASGPARAFLEPAARRAAMDAATAAVLRAVDLPGLERQAVAATRARARARGTGPIGLLTSFAYRLSGRESQAADPEGYLVRWRERAPLAPALEAVRLGLVAPVREATRAVRPALAAALEPTALRQELELAVDRSIARRERLEAPSSRWWPVVGFLQTIATASIALSVVWIILWVLARPPVASVDVPLLGPLPMPFAALVVSLLVGYILARVIGLHAGWLGWRWAARLRAQVEAAVAHEIAERGFAPLDRLEDARRALWTSTREVAAGCGRL
jgi:energy-coupling factor transporter ATP-binding protein EcfA2